MPNLGERNIADQKYTFVLWMIFVVRILLFVCLDRAGVRWPPWHFTLSLGELELSLVSQEVAQTRSLRATAGHLSLRQTIIRARSERMMLKHPDLLFPSGLTLINITPAIDRLWLEWWWVLVPVLGVSCVTAGPSWPQLIHPAHSALSQPRSLHTSHPQNDNNNIHLSSRRPPRPNN